ncbi:MAG TPA: PAS domain S-box protein [Deltaproteobacteria bacterium]|nr:PAS domain S-box protein [Deltaproteobacteria bacterium]
MNADQTERPLRILLVEDSEHDLLAFKRALSKSNFQHELVHFPRAEQALEALASATAEPDLLVSDYKLPGMTGLEMFSIINQQQRNYPVLMLTGSGTEELAVEALKAGVDDYMIKDPQSRYLELLPPVITNVVEKFRDHQARLEAEYDLRESSAKYHAMVENIDGFVYVCSRDYRVEFMNEHLIRRTGYDGTGQLCYKVLHNLDSICPWCVNERVFNGETVKWETISRKDNRWYYMINSPLRHANGTISKQSLIFDITERKRMEQALINSEKKLSDILNLLPDPTFAIDTEGNVILWNRAAEEFTGVKAEDILGKGNYEYAIPFYGERHPMLIDLVLEPSETIEAGYASIKRKNGNIHGESYTRSRKTKEAYIAGVAAVLYDSAGNPLGAIESIRDITEHKQLEHNLLTARQELEQRVEARTEELAVTVKMLKEAVKMLEDEIAVRKQSEEALANSQERLRLAQQAAHIGTFDWDLNARQINWTPELESLYGHAGGTFKRNDTNVFNSIRWKECIHNEDQQRVQQAIQEAILNRTELQLEFRNVWPDSSIHWIEAWAKVICDADGNASRMVGINMDITRRKHDQEVLRKYSEELYDLYNLAPCGYHSLDRDGIFVRINDTELNWLGYSREEVIGKMRFRDLLTDHGKRIFDDSFPQLKQDGHVKDLEQELVRKDGSILPVILSATAINDINGNYIMSRSTLFDITDLKQTEEKLRQNDMLMMQQSRLAAMGEMIGNIAHQWRQPLNTLGLLIQQIPYIYGTEECTKEYFEETCKESMALIDHMSQTIDDFRNFFRPEKEKINFDVNRVISKTVSLVEASFVNQHILLKTECDRQLNVSGHPNEFSQVILAIINNARDAFCEKTEKGRLVKLQTFREADKVIVNITDNAGGIPAEVMDRIFDPYFTTKGPQKGTGIGLYIAKTIIEQNMCGTLTASNNQDGAVFRIELPTPAEPAPIQ